MQSIPLNDTGPKVCDMGMYTKLYFSGVIKKELRVIFKDIALDGQWANSKDEVFSKFGKISRASHIPRGSPWLCSRDWHFAKLENEDNRIYDETTGLWKFYCALKDYESTIKNFLKIIPYFTETLISCQTHYEEDFYETEYELIDGKLFKKEKEEEDPYAY